MANFMKQKVVEEIVRVGLVPVFYNSDVTTSKKIVQACVAGGAIVVEFTNRGEAAPIIFKELITWSHGELPEVIIGVGTILDVATASQYIDSGANFVVGPIYNPEVAALCNRKKVAYIPGCMTPSEIIAAEKTGAEIIKVFPGSTVGPEFIKALRGPCPWLNLMPSGGVEVSQHNISSWMQAGAVALNIGSNLIRKDLVKAGDFTSLQTMVTDCINWIKEAREKNTATRY
jgi:2-dehydro-3-deoxyphosphogluconate aldolase/(4S)-4-hydroxy-2-oxoglutarate aldolase